MGGFEVGDPDVTSVGNDGDAESFVVPDSGAFERAEDGRDAVFMAARC